MKRLEQLERTSMKEPLIIAEAGVNHNGDFEKAKMLIKLAAECGADFVKFHMAYADRIQNRDKYNRLWGDRHGTDENFCEFVKRAEFSRTQFKELFEFATSLGINFMITPYDIPALEQTLDIGIRNIKLASCDIVKDEYIKLATKEADLLVIATGMAFEKEIEHAMNLIDKRKTYVLHCISEYPAPIEHSNLCYINHLKRKYKVKVGFSDHTADIIVPLLAVAKGAQMIEKHFMLDNDANCPDYDVSVTKDKLKDLVYHAKNIKSIYGDEKKKLSDKEYKNREKFRYRWK